MLPHVPPHAVFGQLAQLRSLLAVEVDPSDFLDRDRLDALDHLLASRVFRRGKATGRYDATIDDLTAIKQALETVWKGWKSQPRRSIALLAEDQGRKERGA